MKMRTLFAAAGLALGMLPAGAHHETSDAGQYLAFWAGYVGPAGIEKAVASCRDGLFWEKGFISIYSQGQEAR